MCPPHILAEATDASDHGKECVLSDIAGSPLSDWASLEASLSSSLGSLPIQNAFPHAPTVFQSSLDLTKSLVVNIWDESNIPSFISHPPFAMFWPLLLTILSGVLLMKWMFLYISMHSFPQLMALFDQLLALIDPRLKALAVSFAIGHAGD